MKYVIYAILLASILLLPSCRSTNFEVKEPEFFVDEQEFVLTPENYSLETAAAARVPRLVVRLSIKPELDASSQPTGKRYGQAAFFWTDISRSNGGSNLGGTASIVLRDPANFNATEHLTYDVGPVMTNIDLYTQPTYQDHLIKTSAINYKGALCIEIWGLNLVSTNGYKLYGQMSFTENYDSKPILAFCQSNAKKTGTELRLVNIREQMIYFDSGKVANIPLGILNVGPKPAENVVVSINIADIGTPVISDQSGLFDCVSQPKSEISGIQITCTALRPITGFNTLPIIIDSEYPYDIPVSVYLIESKISTSSVEQDITNNSLLSFLVYN